MKIPATLALSSALLLSAVAAAQQPGFGTSEDREFGDSLWRALEQRNLVGEDALMAKTYEGTEPHGSILVTLDGEVEVDGERGTVIVKRNYGGEGATMESVANDPASYLMATTVMFRRDGFDPENGDWFWAKYLPDGSYDVAPDDATPLVGAAQGCISCHREASGGDMVYLHDRYQ